MRGLDRERKGNMARPVNADGEATAKRILDAAFRCYLDGGGFTSIRDIAREAKVSLAMIHHYFGSKAKLYERLCEDGLRLALAQQSVGGLTPNELRQFRVWFVLNYGTMRDAT
jgi:AcrR family transcriptional regulator